ncbi:MAG: hypothetical protein R2844_16725 [Caldilineales bacterium]
MRTTLKLGLFLALLPVLAACQPASLPVEPPQSTPKPGQHLPQTWPAQAGR